MTQTCAGCGAQFTARRGAKWCGDACRKRTARNGPRLPLDLDGAGPVLSAVRAELAGRGLAGHPHGQVALLLAAALDQRGGESASGVAALSRELRASLAALPVEQAPGKLALLRATRREDARQGL